MKAYQDSLRLLVAMAVTAVLCSSCVSGSTLKTDEAALPAAAESTVDDQAGAVVKSVALVDMQSGCSLSFLTGAPPQYTVFKLTDPHRIIVDLPEFALAEHADLSIADNDFIAGLTSEKIQDRERDYLRLTVALRDDWVYTTSSDATSLTIDISRKMPDGGTPAKTTAAVQPAASAAVPASGRPVISSIVPHTGPDGMSIELVSAAPIGTYNAYTLKNPSRFVIDLPGARASIGTSRIAVNNAFVEQIRLGSDPRNLRVVVDIASPTLPQYQIAKQGASLMVHLQSVAVSSPAKAAEASGQPVAPEPVLPTESVALEESVPVGDEAAAAPQQFSGPNISFDFKDADIKNVLRLIADISGRNMIISEAVTGRVTLKLDNIPLDEALELILETNALGSIVTKNITRIETRERIKAINEEKLLARQSHEEVVDLEIRTFDVSYTKAQDVAQFLKQLKVLSPRGSATSFRLTNKVVVKDIPENISRIAELIREQDVPTRQVMIEARVVQSNPSYTKQLGISWGGTYTTTKDGNPINIGGGAGGNNIVNLPAPIGPGSGGGINLGYIRDNLTLNMQLSALENDDKIKIVSNPRVIGLDNQEALIKQGVALPYAVLNENGVTSTEFKDAVLELEVTPKITPQNTITLELKITKNQKSSQVGQDNAPGIDVREVETFLLVQSGVTAVIGGIYETTQTLNIKTVPFFGTLPYFGYFFRNEKQEEQLTELLVFLTVTILDAPGTIAQGPESVSG